MPQLAVAEAFTLMFEPTAPTSALFEMPHPFDPNAFMFNVPLILRVAPTQLILTPLLALGFTFIVPSMRTSLKTSHWAPPPLGTTVRVPMDVTAGAINVESSPEVNSSVTVRLALL